MTQHRLLFSICAYVPQPGQSATQQFTVSRHDTGANLKINTMTTPLMFSRCPPTNLLDHFVTSASHSQTKDLYVICLILGLTWCVTPAKWSKVFASFFMCVLESLATAEYLPNFVAPPKKYGCRIFLNSTSHQNKFS